jgi:hypothetical protein
MMKRSHAVIGASAGVALAKTIGDSMVAGGVVASLAALLPDLDHPTRRSAGSCRAGGTA